MRLLIFLVLVKLLFAFDNNQTVLNKTYIVATTSKWEPFNTEINGKLVGISVDYWKLIAKKAGIKYKFEIKPTWISVLESIKNQKADLSLGAGKTEEREKYAVFTKPYVSFPLVIATKNDIGFIPNVTFLQNKLIAVGRGYTAEALLKKNYPNLNILSVETIDKALELVKEGKVYAAIDILPVVAYKINKYQFKDLKISGQLNILFPVRFMVNKKEKDLVPILNKAIDTITFEEREKIYQKWIKAQDTAKDYFYLVLILGVTIVFLLLWVFYLKKRLKNEKEYEKILQNVAFIDTLTGANNQKKLLEYLETFVTAYELSSEKFCVIFLEVKNLLDIKSNFGHQVGDIVLVELSSLIQGYLDKRMIFGRWDKDEFMIISPQCDMQKACEVARFLKEKIEEYNFGISRPLEISMALMQYEGGDLDLFIDEIKQNARVDFKC